MDLIHALLLGIIQGITEWLPVSSSGHLVIAQEMLGLSAEENLLFDLFVHAGTLAAVCGFFRREILKIILAMFKCKDMRDENDEKLRKLGYLILIATIPVGITGILLTDVIEEIFTLQLVGAALLINAVVLVLAERTGTKNTNKSVGFVEGMAAGIFQAVAIFPGISRSGSTISGGLFTGLEREVAATFAFLLSVPALVAAFAYGIVKLDIYDSDMIIMSVGAVTAFMTGLISIGFLLKAVKSGKLWIFGAYCAILGAIVVAFTI